MSGKQRINWLILLVLVGAVHGVVLLWWSRHPPPPLPPPAPQAIPVLLLPAAPPRTKDQPVSRQQSAPPPRRHTETLPRRKRRQTLFMKGRRGDSVAAVRSLPESDGQALPYGIWTVRPQAPQGSALARLMRAFDCARLAPQYGRLGCPPVPVNLMAGMEDKIAAIAALEAQGIYSSYGPRLRQDGAGNGQVLGTTGPVGAASSDAALERIPPKYPDPSFGD